LGAVELDQQLAPALPIVSGVLLGGSAARVEDKIAQLGVGLEALTRQRVSRCLRCSVCLVAVLCWARLVGVGAPVCRRYLDAERLQSPVPLVDN
jgi:hypothetical protein